MERRSFLKRLVLAIAAAPFAGKAAKAAIAEVAEPVKMAPAPVRAIRTPGIRHGVGMHTFSFCSPATCAVDLEVSPASEYVRLLGKAQKRVGARAVRRISYVDVVSDDDFERIG